MALQLVTSMRGKFKGAGSVILKKLKPDGTPSQEPKDIYILNKTGMSVINAAWAPETEELRDENNSEPIHIYVKGMKNTVGVASVTEDPYFDIFLKGGEVKVEADGRLTVPDVFITIPENGTYELKTLNENEAPQLDDKEPILVRDVVTGEYYTRVDTAAPQEGEFKVDAAGGELVFSTVDAGKTVYMTATYKAGKVTEFNYSKDIKLTTYELTLAGYFQQYDEEVVEYINETYPAVTLASGELASMARQLSPAGTKTYSFQSVASKGGQGVKRVTGQPPVVIEA